MTLHKNIALLARETLFDSVICIEVIKCYSKRIFMMVVFTITACTLCIADCVVIQENTSKYRQCLKIQLYTTPEESICLFTELLTTMLQEVNCHCSKRYNDVRW